MGVGLKPLGKNVLVRRIPGSKETLSGIILKVSMENDKAEILGVGDKVTQVEINSVCFVDWNRSVSCGNGLYILPEENVVFVYE